MNKILLVFMAAIAVTSAAAQTENSTATLYADISVERQEIVAGPYARYAQKYLGIAAPLADKVLFAVTSVELLEERETEQSRRDFSPERTPTHMNPAQGFPRLTVDKTSSAVIGLEESARLAAEQIFEIRRSRLDLITGNAGENVFGGGLSSALRELDRLEEEYLSLFLGRLTTRIETKQYGVTPTQGKYTYIVCRFSDVSGLLSADDMSGEPVVLDLKYADGRPLSGASLAPERPSSRAVPRIVPADMQCRVIFDGKELASETLRIPQLGTTVYVAQ